MRQAENAEKGNFVEDGAGRPVRCEECNRLLGIFVVAEGEIKCERCGRMNRIFVERPRKARGGPRYTRARL